MSRTIFAGVLVTCLAITIGCGSKSEPPLPSVPADAGPTVSIPAPGETQPTPPAPTPPAPVDPNAGTPAKVESPVPWEIDADKHAIPAEAVRGRISGANVTPEVLVTGDELIFRVHKAGTQTLDRSVSLKLAPFVPGQPTPPILGRNWKVKAADNTPNVPEIWQEVQGQPILLHPNGYALTLELGARKDGKVTGKIYLTLPDKDQSVLAGTFTADYFRPHTEAPGADDLPFAKGAVTVVGAKPDAQIRVAYSGITPAGLISKELQLEFDPAREEMARWVPDEIDRPRTSRLISGDGRTRPFRYEHLRLPPGRYLLSAGVVGGPSVWKWVDVAPGSAVTENFAIDANQTGAAEISTPPEVTGKVTLAPADDPTRPPIDVNHFNAIAFQVVRQDANIVGGKALLKNLAPGKYEVRAGELRGTVDVFAGKTAELALGPPKK